MKKIVVKPRSPKVVVLDDNGRQIPAEGKEVRLTPHIVRRMKDGDLVEASGKTGGKK